MPSTRRPTRLGIGLLVGLAALAWGATSASAYQRTMTCNSFGTYECKPGEEPQPIAWPVRCVRYRINDQGSDDFSEEGPISDRLRELTVEAFEAWNAPSCSNFTMVEGPLTSNATARYRQKADWQENMNLVVWRDDRWPYSSLSAAFALTSVTYNSKTARIVDADIEINSEVYDFTNLTQAEAGETNRVDFSNTMVHEVGHFLGLGHSQKENATMFRSASTGEIMKRTLARDDVNGLCAIYPGEDRVSACQYPQNFEPPPPPETTGQSNEPAGCSVGGGGIPPVSALLGLALLTFAVRGVRPDRTDRTGLGPQ